MKMVQSELFDTKSYDPDSELARYRAKADALERAGRPRFHWDPDTGIPTVQSGERRLERDVATSSSSAPAGTDKRRQAHDILSSPRFIRGDIIARLADAEKYAGMHVSFRDDGTIKDVAFIERPYDHVRVRGYYSGNLPQDFEAAQKVCDAILRRLQ